MKPVQNIAASVRQRLLNRSKADNRSFNELLQYYAMVKLGELNSRMKDFYDIWILSRQFRFELSFLAEAVKLTFEQRGTELKESVAVFSADFISSRQTMWTAFRNRLKQERIPASFQEIISELQLFLEPIVKGASGDKVWQPAGPWS